MKKSLCALMVALSVVCSLAVFAEADSGEYLVKAVTGKVEREVSSGTWEAVKPGMKLSPSAVVTTGLSSSLQVVKGERVVTVKAMQKGTIDKLVASASTKSGGIKIGAKAKKDDALKDGGPERTNVSTASTRASDAAEDIDWAE